MPDYNKYIGIEFKKHGRDFLGCDCFGLVRLILNNEFDKSIPDWRPDTFDNEGIARKVSEQLFNVTEIEYPEAGDIGLYNYDGLTDHVALYIGDFRILHVLRDQTSCVTRCDDAKLKGRLHGWYRFN